MSICLRRLLALSLIVALIAPQHVGAQTGEASRVRVLIAVDTDDQMGATWGLDGENLKTILAAAAQKQDLNGRMTIETFTGNQVSPEKILTYYENLQVTPTETLVFYYSGHGGYHLTKGHYLALTRGKLYRAALLAAMKKQNPRLVVILTDCCANLAGGARSEEPPDPQIVGLRVRNIEAFPKAKKEEPPVAGLAKLAAQANRPITPPRPNTVALLKGAKAKQEEPPFVLMGLRLREPLNLTRAMREEPPSSTTNGPGKSVSIITAEGTVPLSDIAANTDGEVLRHLLFRHQGVVDINGCKKGALSHGTLQWGGSLFTIGFMSLQKENVARFDTNQNRLVEWSEFFPALQKATEDAGQRASLGKVRQSPEASSLGQPVP
jgi:hypothetical protein